ncbi:MAG: LuxR C-terminal-related transcriptional regulator [Terriglobia bacterium]
MAEAKKSRRQVRILVADEGGVFRLGLKRLFGVEDDLRVVAEADQPSQISELAKKFKPDLLYVQAEMLGTDPVGFISRLYHEWPKGRAIIMVPGPTEEGAEHYVREGAAGVIAKSVDPALFVNCVRKVMNGEVWMPRSRPSPQAGPAQTPPLPERRPADTLTRREKSVISCLVQGWHNREIAQHLKITEQTVKNHLRTIYDKVGVSDRLELALYAIHKRLELPPVTIEPAATT